MAAEALETPNDAAVPLLVSKDHHLDALGSISGLDQDVDYDSRQQQPLRISEPKESATWYIWTLTFSSGISGLLFGYEYCNFIFPPVPRSLRQAGERTSSLLRREFAD